MRTIYLMLLSILLMNCVAGLKEIRYYRVDNDTERVINLHLLDRYKNTINKYSVNGKGLILEKKVLGGTGSKPSLNEALSYADTILVVFDNEKVQGYPLDYDADPAPNWKRDLFYDEAYEVVNDELYVFTFTEEDYENAAECDGACE